MLSRMCASILAKRRLGAQIVLSLLLASSIGLLGWSLWPAPRRVQGFMVDSQRFPELAGTPYRLELEWPTRLRVGERGQVTLRLEPVEDADALLSGETSGEYMLEGRLELDGLAPVSRETAQTALPLGGAAEVAWADASPKIRAGVAACPGAAVDTD